MALQFLGSGSKYPVHNDNVTAYYWRSALIPRNTIDLLDLWVEPCYVLPRRHNHCVNYLHVNIYTRRSSGHVVAARYIGTPHEPCSVPENRPRAKDRSVRYSPTLDVMRAGMGQRTVALGTPRLRGIQNVAHSDFRGRKGAYGDEVFRA